MKTRQEIETEIADLDKQRAILAKDLEKMQYDKLGRRVALLRTCLFYLETEPRPEFIEEMRQKIVDRLARIKTGFKVWLENQLPTKANTKSAQAAKEIYKREMDVPKLNAQLKALNYILEN